MSLILEAIWWIFPAYIANAAPVLFGGGRPLDFGKKFIDNKRILGDGKTVKGTLAGIFLGSLAAYLTGNLYVGMMLASGAVFGDLVGSFVKRRMNKKRGYPVFGIDQLDFVFGALLFAAILEIPRAELLVFILVVTPLLHMITNYLAYKLGFKKVPW
jgi:CDP-2,3-bis-(O-geranylgeranyl)-sn-glycerol synthase